MSLKRQKQNRDWPEIRAFVMERDNWTCQLAVRLERSKLLEYHPCWGPIDPHHIVPVARDSKLRLDPDNLVCLCRRGHDWVHTHPVPATLLGLLKSAPS